MSASQCVSGPSVCVWLYLTIYLGLCICLSTSLYLSTYLALSTNLSRSIYLSTCSAVCLLDHRLLTYIHGLPYARHAWTRGYASQRPTSLSLHLLVRHAVKAAQTRVRLTAEPSFLVCI